MREYPSPNARRAIARYGEAVCREAWRLHIKEGYGAAGIANGTSVGTVCRTTNAANAAINAGLEMEEMGRESPSPNAPPYSTTNTRDRMREIERADRALRLAFVCHEAALKRYRAKETGDEEYLAVRREYDAALERWHRADLALQPR